VLARRVRRRRRRAPDDPAGAVLGAWHETLDHLSRAGVPLGAAMTASDVARTAAATLGAAPVTGLDRLAALVNRARFAPGAVRSDAVAESWAMADRLRSAVVDRTSLRARLDPRVPGPRPPAGITP
jgi:hypothetical protein